MCQLIQEAKTDIKKEVQEMEKGRNGFTTGAGKTKLVRVIERRAVEQWSDREVEVGVLIREKQTPLSPCPPGAHAWEDRGPLPASININTHSRSLAKSKHASSLTNTVQSPHVHAPAGD